MLAVNLDFRWLMCTSEKLQTGYISFVCFFLMCCARLNESIFIVWFETRNRAGTP